MKTNPIPMLTPRQWQRIWVQLDRSGPCWLWTGSVGSGGYGAVSVGGKRYLVHRVAYSHLVGPIPDGFVVDHVCCSLLCCHPDHLEAVTNAENARRGGPCVRGLRPDGALDADIAGVPFVEFARDRLRFPSPVDYPGSVGEHMMPMGCTFAEYAEKVLGVPTVK